MYTKFSEFSLSSLMYFCLYLCSHIYHLDQDIEHFHNPRNFLYVPSQCHPLLNFMFIRLGFAFNVCVCFSEV